MTHYNSEIARKLYYELTASTNLQQLFPITVELVDGILTGNYLYGHYNSDTGYNKGLQLEVSAEILRLASWEERRNRIGEILEANKEKQAA